MAKSAGEEALYAQIKFLRLPLPEREYRFAPPRKWRFDFCWIARKLAIEIEGGVFSRGRHTRPGGFIKDIEKYNAAASLGWTVMRFTTSQAKSGFALNTIESLLKAPL